MLALAFALLPLLVGRPGQSLCLGIYCGLIRWGEALLLSLAGGPPTTWYGLMVRASGLQSCVCVDLEMHVE